MKRQFVLLALLVCALDCVLAAPKAVEIQSAAEIQRYARLKTQAKQREPETRAAKIRSRFESKTRHRVEIALSPDGRKYLRVTGYLPDIRYRASIHNAKTGALLLHLPPPQEEGSGAFQPQWSPNGKTVSFSEVENQNALFFDAQTGKKLWEGGNYYLYSPRGQTLAMIEEGVSKFRDAIVIRHLRTGKILRRLSPRLTSYRLVLEFFSPDGSELYVRASGNDTRRWRLNLK